jgi:hypothetical protein
LAVAALFALWINLHGSWVFGLVVLVMIIASGLVEGEWGLVVAQRWSTAELRKLLLALGASLAALFVNPFGYRLVLFPLKYEILLRRHDVMQRIVEWQGVDFSTPHGKLALMVIFGLLAAALFSRRRWRLDEVLLTAFALWAALSHLRFLFFAGLIMAPILAPRLKLFPPYERELDKPWLNAGIMAGRCGRNDLFLSVCGGATAASGPRVSHGRAGIHAATAPQWKDLQPGLVGRIHGMGYARVEALYGWPHGHIRGKRYFRRLYQCCLDPVTA